MRLTFVLMLAMSVVVLSACGSTSTPDLNVTILLHCGSDNDDCSIDGDVCRGSGRFNDLRSGMEVRIERMNGDLVDRAEADDGVLNAANNTCTFTTTHGMKSSAGYQIYAGDRGPFTVTKTTLENSNWAVTYEFNN